MLGQLNMYGNDRVEQAIERIKTFEPPEGYYLAFSGGKDSVVIKALADMAGVKYDAHYNLTTVDPPELVYFIREQHPDVVIDKPGMTMWELIPKKKMPPTRKVRYCCEVLKEKGGEGRFAITGIRWAESGRRKNTRAGLEKIHRNKEKRVRTDPDNPDNAKLTEICQAKSKRVLNPIIDWADNDVWDFIKKYNIPYCKLYDEGFKRLGCIGCPNGGAKGMTREFKRYPKIRQAYIRAFERMLIENPKEGNWKTGEDVMKWWIGG